ncbi:type II secretion system protein [uncultured Fibrobacter sp.]|uniref:PulJ/GspJ family protein n=1 Tax=uncultured Fibrobacter sp. TaxID=261512 RepID=UPI0026095A0A|nr:type II secretion system protein [uncultured Fibrobacter sp.]
MRRNKCSGFTLMELTVYMGILGIIVLVAGRAYSDSAKSRIRTGNMIEASREAENIATMFKDDVTSMGAKSSLENHAVGGSASNPLNDEFSAVYQNVYVDPVNDDYSSFEFEPETPNPDPDSSLEKFIFRRVRYGSDADNLGKYEGVEEVTWFLEDGVLKRTCRDVHTKTAARDSLCAPETTSEEDLPKFTVSITNGVKLFRVLPSIPSVSEDVSGAGAVNEFQMFPPPSGSGEFRLSSRVGVANLMPLGRIGEPGTSVSLTGFAPNFDENSDDVPSVKKYNEVYVSEKSDALGDWKTLCAKSQNHFDFVPGQEYELSFGVSIPEDDEENAKTFIPGKDHMAVGFRNADGDKIDNLPDHIFYPPSVNQANGYKRTMRFSVPDTVKNACMAFTFSTFSPTAASGTVSISDLKLIKVASSMYKFDPTLTYVKKIDKKNVKAFQLRLKIKRGGQDLKKGESGEATLVVPVPSNGLTD